MPRHRTSLVILALLLFPCAWLAAQDTPQIIANVQFVRLSEPVDLPEWAIPNSSGTNTRILSPTEFGQLPKELKDKPGVEVLSSSTVTFLSGKSATISVGQTLAFDQQGNKIDPQKAAAENAEAPNEYFSGTKVTVSGEVKDDDQLALTVEYLLSEFEGFIETQQSNTKAPIFSPVFHKTGGQSSVTMTPNTCIPIGGQTSNKNGEFQQTLILLSAKLGE